MCRLLRFSLTAPVFVAALMVLAYGTLGCQSIDTRLDLPLLSEQAIIPIPVAVDDAEGNVFLSELKGMHFYGGADSLAPQLGQRLVASPDTAGVAPTDDLAWLAAAGLGKATVVKSVRDEDGAQGAGSLNLRPDASLPEEGYRLEVQPDRVDVYASAGAGFFYGLQTLRQLYERAAPEDGRLACGTITDSPRYAFRGVMLDIARHFHGPEELRRVIDLMARYKLNIFHLHLSDDQGWRIEIKAYPKLTSYGATTQVGGGGGGFLTQAEYSAIVAYAAARYITIVPEIDMPGHTNAALASYPELTCDGKAPELYEGIEVGFSTFCIGKPEVTEFVTKVFSELAAITPGPYIHMGGDESHATDSLDYRAFFEEVTPVVRGLGKRPIGWDEVVTAGVNPTVIAQWWASEENAQLAVERGHKVIVSPATKAYLDMQYDSTSRIGLHWAAYVPVDSAYSWDPAKMLPQIVEEDILGVESPLWTETAITRDDLDYLMFPRMLGYAEIGWSPAERRDWEEYKGRLATEGVELDAMGVEFYRSDRVEWSKKKEVQAD